MDGERLSAEHGHPLRGPLLWTCRLSALSGGPFQGVFSVSEAVDLAWAAGPCCGCPRLPGHALTGRLRNEQVGGRLAPATLA